MTDQNSGQNDGQASDEVKQTETVDVNALMSRLDKLESHNANLTNDVKEWRTKAKAVKTEMESKEQERMHESNDFKGLYEKSVNEVAEMKNTLLNQKKVGLRNTFNYEVAKHAGDAQDTDLLIAALNSKSSSVAYDNENDSWQGIPDAITELRTEKPFLFKTDKPGMVSGRPQTVPVKEQTLDEAMMEDSSGILAKAIGQLLT